MPVYTQNDFEKLFRPLPHSSEILVYIQYLIRLFVDALGYLS